MADVVAARRDERERERREEREGEGDADAVVRRTAGRSRVPSLAGIALAVIPHLLHELVRRGRRRRRRRPREPARRAREPASRPVSSSRNASSSSASRRSTPSTRSRAHSTSSSARSSGGSGGAGGGGGGRRLRYQRTSSQDREDEQRGGEQQEQRRDERHRQPVADVGQRSQAEAPRLLLEGHLGVGQVEVRDALERGPEHAREMPRLLRLRIVVEDVPGLEPGDLLVAVRDDPWEVDARRQARVVEAAQPDRVAQAARSCRSRAA